MHRKIFIIALATLLLLTMTLVFFFFLQKDQETSQIDKRRLIPARPDSFQEGLNIYLNIIKKARVSLYENDLYSSEFSLNEAKTLWNDILDEYNNKVPKGLDQNTWHYALLETKELGEKAYELFKENDLSASIDKLDELRSLLGDKLGDDFIKKEDEQLFLMLLSTKELSRSGSSSKAELDITQLKMKFAEIKYLQETDKYRESFSNFESALSDLDNSSQHRLEKTKTKLIKSFFEIYRIE